MRFKLDENMPTEAAELLRSKGYDAHTVFDECIVGGSDESLLEICNSENRVLITFDLDFAQVLSYPPSTHCGIVVLRYKQQGKLYVLEHFNKLLPHFKEAIISSCLWIVSEDKIRVKR